MLAATTLAGCGSEPAAAPMTYPSLAELVTAVAQRQQADRSVSFTATRTVNGPDAVQAGCRGTAVWDQGGRSVHGDAVLVPFDTTFPVKAEIVLVPGTVYVRPTNVTRLPPATPWLAEGTGVPFRMSDGYRELAGILAVCADPFEVMARFGTAFTLAGSTDEVLDGVPTSRLEFRARPTSAPPPPPGGGPDPVAAAVADMAASVGLESAEATFWLDRAGRPVRVRFAAGTRPPRQPAAPVVRLVLDTRYRDWAAPAAPILAPQAGQLSGRSS